MACTSIQKLCRGLVVVIFLLQLCTAVDAEPASTASTISAGVSVVKTLMKVFSKDKETVKDLTAADELVRGLTFDLFNEHLSCKVMKGIMLKDFETVVAIIVDQYSIPKTFEQDILLGQFMDENDGVTVDFKFSKGEVGGFTYGRVATVKHGDKIDMAYSIYFLEYKLSPRVIEHTKKKKFLGFTTGKKVWRETQERNLSIKDQDYMKTYFMMKAIEGFKEQYPGLIESQYTALKKLVTK